MYRYFGAYRAFLALLVLVEHFVPFLSGWHTDIAFGRIGVSLFFVVSGFVIFEALDIFYKDRSVAFLKNRFLRIYPPYLFALLVSIFLMFVAVAVHKNGVPYQPDIMQPSALGSLRKLLWNVVALFDPRNAYTPPPYPLYVRTLWTVVIEIQFYVFMAFRPSLLKTCILVGVAYVLHLILPLHSVFRIAEFIPYFFVGAAVYYKKNMLVLFAGIVSVCNFASLLPIYDTLSVVFFSLFLVVFWGLSLVNSKSPSIKKIDTFLGDLTYPLYLNHYAIGMVLCAFFPKSPLLFFSGVIIALWFSWVAHAIVEPPIVKIRNAIRGQTL